MTFDEQGRVLRECETRMELMRAAEGELGKSVGTLGQQMNRLSDNVGSLSIEVGVVSRMMREEVLPEIKGMPRLIAAAIRDHEAECPVSSAVRDKTRKDVTQRLLISQSPPPSEGISSAPEVVREKLVTRQRLIQAAAGAIIAAISAASVWLAS